MDGNAGRRDRDPRLQLHGWLDPPLRGVAVIMAAAGFAQFSPTAALADVAEHFGSLRDGDTVAEQAGLPGTVLGAGLAVIRLAALAALPLAALADHRGRRPTLLTWVSLGLLAAIAAAASPGYWWFVGAFALARPLLTATDTIGEIVAAEHTAARDRAKAIAFVTAAYGFGSGVVAVLRPILGGLGFRAVFALSVVPLVLVRLTAGWVVEPSRYRPAAEARAPSIPVLGAVRRELRGRVAVLAGLTFASGLVTGPINTFLFVYAENIGGMSSAFTGALVVANAPTALGGLLLGRYLSDRVGRRPTAAIALVGLCAAGILAYSGSTGALVVGYLAGGLTGSAYATPAVTLAAELIPTSVRASAAGWLVFAGVLGATSGLLLVGAVADAADSLGTAVLFACVPAAASAVLLTLVPETRASTWRSPRPNRAEVSRGGTEGRRDGGRFDTEEEP